MLLISISWYIIIFMSLNKCLVFFLNSSAMQCIIKIVYAYVNNMIYDV